MPCLLSGVHVEEMPAASGCGPPADPLVLEAGADIHYLIGELPARHAAALSSGRMFMAYLDIAALAPRR